MASHRKNVISRLGVAVFVVYFTSITAYSQLPTVPPRVGNQYSYGSSGYKPRAYHDYYKQQLNAYKRPSMDARQYVWDRYHGGNPRLSPYLSLFRNTGPGVNNYYSYVRPELKLRKIPAPKQAAPKLNPINVPGAQQPGISNPYYRQYYGGSK